YERVVRRYQVQAARLLLIAHPLMALALFLPNADPFTDYALRTLFITDTLAVLFVAVVPFVPRVAPDLRLAAGVAVLVGGALLDLYSPSSDVGRVIHEILCGVDPTRPHLLISNYALLPLTGMFLIGTWIGSHFARAQLSGGEVAYSAGLARSAA